MPDNNLKTRPIPKNKGTASEIEETIKNIPLPKNKGTVLTGKGEKKDSPFPNFTGTENPCPKNKGINNNKINNNSINTNLSIYKDDGLIDGKKYLSSLYTQNEDIIKSTIHKLTNYENALSAQKENDDIEAEAFRLFNNALIDMLLSKETMLLTGREVSASSICDKLNEYMEEKDGKYNIDTLKEISIDDFVSASKEKKIRNHLKYMQACIWSAMQKGRAGIKADAAIKEEKNKKKKVNPNEAIISSRRSGEIGDLAQRALEEMK